MVAGPFDQRKQRSRCIACSASHLKVRGSPFLFTPDTEGDGAVIPNETSALVDFPA